MSRWANKRVAMAAKILRGEATAEEMPYETVTEYEIYFNSNVMSDLDITAELDENAVDVAGE